MQSMLMLATVTAGLLFGGLEATDSTQVEKLKTGTRVGHQVPHFKAELIDPSRKGAEPVAFDAHQADKPTVYVFYSQSCPYCKMYQERAAGLAKQFGEKVNFFMVYPLRNESPASKLRYHVAGKFPCKMINDKGAKIAKKLGISKTPEIVLTSKTGQILYRGCFDDAPASAKKVKQHFLADAIKQHLAGERVNVASSRLYG